MEAHQQKMVKWVKRNHVQFKVPSTHTSKNYKRQINNSPMGKDWHKEQPYITPMQQGLQTEACAETLQEEQCGTGLRAVVLNFF